MNKYRIYRPNMSDYHIVTGTRMIVSDEGVAIIYNDNDVVAIIPKITPVVLEQN